MNLALHMASLSVRALHLCRKLSAMRNAAPWVLSALLAITHLFPANAAMQATNDPDLALHCFMPRTDVDITTPVEEYEPPVAQAMQPVPAISPEVTYSARVQEAAVSKSRLIEPPEVAVSLHIEPPRVYGRPVEAAQVHIVRSRGEVAVKQRARTALESGSAEHAYSLLVESLVRANTDREHLALLAVAALHSGRFAEAEVVYTHLITLDGSQAQWWMGLAAARETQGKSAAEMYQQVVVLEDVPTHLSELAKQRLQPQIAMTVPDPGGGTT